MRITRSLVICTNIWLEGKSSRQSTEREHEVGEQLLRNFLEDHSSAQCHLIFLLITSAQILEIHWRNLLTSSHVRPDKVAFEIMQKNIYRTEYQKGGKSSSKTQMCTWSIVPCWELAVDNNGWEEQGMRPGWIDHHLLQGYSNEKRLPETFLVNMVVPVLWHQVPMSSSPECCVALWSPREV